MFELLQALFIPSNKKREFLHFFLSAAKMERELPQLKPPYALRTSEAGLLEMTLGSVGIDERGHLYPF